jgi:predicted nucleotidyltransferase
VNTLPIFRSPQQLEVLTYLMIHAGRSFTVPEIVRATGVSQPTVWREIRRLSEAGLIDVTSVGRSQVVEVDQESLYFPELHSLALKLRGPAHLLGARLEEVPGVEEAYVFGSWAARYRGTPGGPPADLDVLVVGPAEPDAVEAALAPFEQSFGVPVNPVVVSRSDWDRAESGFVRQVKKSDRVQVLDRAS